MGRPRTAAEQAKFDADTQAFSEFRGKATKKRPTSRHRAALWENMLGTVYAVNPAGEIRYFDYDYAEAVAWIGPVEDVRVYRFKAHVTMLQRLSGEDYARPTNGKLVWWVRDVQEPKRYRLETRNDWHEVTRKWASHNPFDGGRPWRFDTVDDAKMRGAILMSTNATAFRIIDTTTDAVVYRHEAES